jgi:hypothetical protein
VASTALGLNSQKLRAVYGLNKVAIIDNCIFHNTVATFVVGDLKAGVEKFRVVIGVMNKKYYCSDMGTFV